MLFSVQACWLICCGFSVGQNHVAQDDLVRAIRTAYEANRLALEPFGETDFELSIGQASSIDAALEDRWTTRHTARGFYAYDGDQAIYSCLFPYEEIVAAQEKRGDRWTSPLHSTRVLTNGTITLVDRPHAAQTTRSMDHFAQILPGSESFEQEIMCPLKVGRAVPGSYDLGDLIQRTTHPSEDIRLEIIEDDQAARGHIIHLAFTRGVTRRDYWIDLEHGAIPLEVQSSEDGAVMRRIVHEDLRFVGGKSWYPHRKTIYFESSGLTKRITVNRANFDSPPKRSAFRMEFPEAIPLINVASKTRYDPQKVWNLARLPSPSSPASRPILLSDAATVFAPLPGEREPRPRWAIPALFLGLAVLCGVLWRSLLAGSRRRSTRGGYSLIELLAVIAILGLLLALILPAVQASRSLARRVQCANNLRQIGLALNHYVVAHGYYPSINAPTAIQPGKTSPFYGHLTSPLTRMLSELDQKSLYDATNYSWVPTNPIMINSNYTVMTTSITLFLCPADRPTPITGYGRVNYRFNIGPTPWFVSGETSPASKSGPFNGRHFYRPANFKDGLSLTVAASERFQGDWTKGVFDAGGDYLLTDFEIDKAPGDADQALAACSRSASLGLNHESRSGESWFLSGFHFTTYNHCAPPNYRFPDCALEPFIEPIPMRVMHDGVFAARSHHRGGVNTLSMDGSVRFTRDSIELAVWRAIATRSGGEVVSRW